MSEHDKPLKKVCIICAKGSIEDVYATLVMANGAVMEGIEAKVFFTFFGLDAITKKQMNKLHTATVGNPAMRMPGGLPFPTILVITSYSIHYTKLYEVVGGGSVCFETFCLGVKYIYSFTAYPYFSGFIFIKIVYI